MFKKFLLTTVLAAFLVLPNISNATRFDDVPNTNIHDLPIHFLRSIGAVIGYPDNTYRPSENVNRDFAARAVLATYQTDSIYHLPVAVLDPAISHPDISVNDWFGKYIYKAAHDYGVFLPDSNDYYYPHSPVTRAEMIKLMLEPSGLDLSSYATDQLYTDIPTYTWYAKYMNFAGKNGLITPDKAGNLYPGKNISRGEAADIGYSLMLILKKQNTALISSQIQANILKSLEFVSLHEPLSAKRQAAYAVGLGEMQYLTDPTNDTFVANAKLAKANLYSINYLLFSQNASTQKIADAWLKLAQTKLDEAIQLNPGLSTIADQIKTIWPS